MTFEETLHRAFNSSVPKLTLQLRFHKALPDSQHLDTTLLEKERNTSDSETDVVGLNTQKDEPVLDTAVPMDVEPSSQSGLLTGMDPETNEDQHNQEASVPELHTLRLPPSSQTKAKNLQQVSFTKRLMDFRSRRYKRKRKKKRPRRSYRGTKRKRGANTATPTSERTIERMRLAEEELDRQAEQAEEARHHLEQLSDPSSSLKTALTINDVGSVYDIRHEAHGPLNVLESTRRMSNFRRAQEQRKVRAKAKEVARLKRSTEEHSTAQPQGTSITVDPHTGFCRKCHHYHAPRHGSRSALAYPMTCSAQKLDVRTVVAYGAAGSGIGSRIGGHLRWGGAWIREQLLRQGVLILLTDEYNTSKTCVFCSQRLEQSRSRRLIGVELRLKPVHGSVRCHNPLCPAVKAGYATRGRDGNAGIGILLSAASTSLKLISNAGQDRTSPPPWPLMPYSRHLRPATINTGEESPEHKQETVLTDGPPSSATRPSVGSSSKD